MNKPIQSLPFDQRSLFDRGAGHGIDVAENLNGTAQRVERVADLVREQIEELIPLPQHPVPLEHAVADPILRAAGAKGRFDGADQAERGERPLQNREVPERFEQFEHAQSGDRRVFLPAGHQDQREIGPRLLMAEGIE